MARDDSGPEAASEESAAPRRSGPGFGPRRFILEALSVTAGILLAFAIDAWWSEVEQDRVLKGLQDAARSEAASNREQLDRALRSGETSLTSAQALVSLIGPDPAMIPADSIARLLGGALTHDAALLELSATDRLLRAGDVGAFDDAEFHTRMVRFRSTAGRYLDYGRSFEVAREKLIDELARVGPTGFLSASKGVHPPSDFPVPVRRILSDPGMEGAVGNLAVWADNLNRGARLVRARMDSVWTSLPSDSGR